MVLSCTGHSYYFIASTYTFVLFRKTFGKENFALSQIENFWFSRVLTFRTERRECCKRNFCDHPPALAPPPPPGADLKYLSQTIVDQAQSTRNQLPSTVQTLERPINGINIPRIYIWHTTHSPERCPLNVLSKKIYKRSVFANF